MIRSLLLALALPGALAAQADPLGPYRIAVERYRLGQTTEALRLAGSWRPATVRSDGRRIIDDVDRRLGPGVALLMTELARRDSTARGPEQFAIAEVIVSNLRKNSAETKAFQDHWDAFMTSLFIDELNPAGGRALINRGLRVAGESPRLLLLSGIAFEMATYPHATLSDV